MWPVWEGRSCLPTGKPSNATCTLGAYPVYAVNATNVAQIQLAVNFARNKRLRLVIKNTGHDYQGKSSGAASLSIWTHNLQDLAYMPNYTLGDFSGSVMHVGAGVVTDDLAKAADEHDASVVGGMCAVSILISNLPSRVLSGCIKFDWRMMLTLVIERGICWGLLCGWRSFAAIECLWAGSRPHPGY